METTNNRNFCVILAGGKGRRLWPWSRNDYPKQFIDFFGSGRTQLQITFDRFADILPKENIYVCTYQEYVHIVKEQLPELSSDNLLAEPIHRNTAPSVAWACFRIKQKVDQANIVVSPSDQFVLNEDAFRHNMLDGLDFVANNNLLLTMGVKPTRPEPGYGYLQVGEATDRKNIYRVKSFTEKPEREFARMFMESGEFYWNTGLFLSNMSYLISCFENIFPHVFRQLEKSKITISPEQEQEYVQQNYPAYPNMSMDYGVLERSDNVYVMRCDFGWADMGTWHSIYESMSRTIGDNVVVDSEVLLEDCYNNIIKLPKDRIGVINGLDGYIVAEKDNVLLICKKSDSSSLVRKYVNEVGMKYGEDFV
jgi:mannose-1-phosphate guanylyltransferase